MMDPDDLEGYVNALLAYIACIAFLVGYLLGTSVTQGFGGPP